ncbi:glycosyltransferase family 1 protein [Daejeonella sp. JGW-45]|uniref:glycosyltransferase family 4 protein n=1 Tax=Daejeonella sp. JGW-45 TaxID=3034148 RepID=UPI0023EAD86D|nr:glycosyltransferase family 1 protein [Daejeonella sp. JGW-45]
MANKLVVGIDIRDLRVAKTGARTYLEEILREFKNNDHGCEIKFFDSPFPVYGGRNKVLKLAEHVRFFFWKQAVLPVKAYLNNCDVLFCPDYFVPYIHLGYQPIPLFHDAFFYEYPEQVNPLWLKMFRTLGVSAAKRAPYLVTISEYSKTRLAHFTGIQPQKIISIYNGVKKSPARPPDEPGPVITTPTSKFILHVGVLEKRKNLVKLVEAVKALHQAGHTGYSLVIVGQSSSKDELDGSAELKAAIKRENLEDFVMMYGYASDEELSQLYRTASLYVFPSLNEGFGLPVLEAFHYKLPVLVAGNTCLPEIGGDAVLCFDPFDSHDICDKIRKVVEDPGLAEALVKKGTERLKMFSWQKNAEELVKVFHLAAGKGSFRR